MVNQKPQQCRWEVCHCERRRPQGTRHRVAASRIGRKTTSARAQRSSSLPKSQKPQQKIVKGFHIKSSSSRRLHSTLYTITHIINDFHIGISQVLYTNIFEQEFVFERFYGVLETATQPTGISVLSLYHNMELAAVSRPTTDAVSHTCMRSWGLFSNNNLRIIRTDLLIIVGPTGDRGPKS